MKETIKNSHKTTAFVSNNHELFGNQNVCFDITISKLVQQKSGRRDKMHLIENSTLTSQGNTLHAYSLLGILTTCSSIRLFSCICPTGATTLWTFTISLFTWHNFSRMISLSTNQKIVSLHLSLLVDLGTSNPFRGHAFYTCSLRQWDFVFVKVGIKCI